MLAMDTMPAIGVGMILASIFAATMSTADSQVLACTAAITDDIKPKWREDHKTTKKVTLVVAAFATAISIGGLYVPGGDSVFKLVVLAVYGLGSIFVPLLIIRWMGYKPDSTHTIIMMVSAFTAVMLWSLLPAIMDWKSVASADGVFPSVPGMGAAFAAHFIMNAMRTPDVSSLGRFNWPDRKKIGTFAAIIIIPLAGLEATYLAKAPDSMNSSEPDLDSMWNLTVEYDWTEIDETILISDGATESFYFDVPSDVFAMMFFLNYSESNEVGVSTVCDDIETSHDISELSPEFNTGSGISDLSGKFCGTEDLGTLSTITNYTQNDTYESHIKTIERLQVEKQDSSLAINVKIDVDRGTPLNVDSGEEVYIGVVQFRYISHTLTQIE